MNKIELCRSERPAAFQVSGFAEVQVGQHQPLSVLRELRIFRKHLLFRHEFTGRSREFAKVIRERPNLRDR